MAPRPLRQGHAFKMRWITLGGVPIRYEVSGQGSKTLVLLHEMGGALESWSYVIPKLQPGWRVVRYDWRGMGMSQKVVGDITIEEHAQDLRNLLDYLEIGEPVYLSGCAVGGAIALYFAATHPERTAGIVAICPATGVTPEKRALNLQRADLMAEVGMTEEVIAGLNNSYPPVMRKDPEVYRNYLARSGTNDGRSYAATIRMLSNLNIRAELATISCPTMLLAGEHDKSRPVARTKEVADIIPGSIFKVLDTAHFMHIQTPELVADEIDSFFARPAA